MKPCPNCQDIERRMRNKMQALEVQNKHFQDKFLTFRDATLWERLRMAWRGVW